jgi:hypothetical protein
MIGRFGFVLLAVAVLAGSASAAGRDPWDPKQRRNAADQAQARGIRIQRSDLGSGDWRVEQVADNDESIGPCKNPNLSDLVQTGKADNPNFSRNGSLVGSEGEVWATERDAAKSWSRSMRFPFKTCLAAALKRGLAADPRVKLTVLSSGPVRMEKLASRMFTYRLRLRIKGPGGTIQGRLSIYAFSHGRADGSLMLISFGAPFQPISPALERRLAGLVASRVSS